MTDIERIRRAIGQWKYFREHPQEIDEEIEGWVESVTKAWKNGYQVVVLDKATVEQIGEGHSVDINGFLTSNRQGRPEWLAEPEWREFALRFLEWESEKISSLGDILFIKVNENSGAVEEVISVSDLLEED